ncbi:hypothetical protein, partial [Pantoea ananatis]|uniref:hypothetical protein n=1 Tax=Pantoea ananas TaxID=553 RepID=UPI0023AF68A1
AQPSSSRLPCRAVLAFALSSARRMPPENTRLWGRVFLFGVALPRGFFFNEFALKAGAYFACLRVFTVLH